jgi:Zn-dependent alcohol dehydrogenase
MKACVLRSPARIETNPLEFGEVATPQPAKGEVLVRVTHMATTESSRSFFLRARGATPNNLPQSVS